MRLQRFLDRFISSASFSAYTRLVAQLPPLFVTGLAPLSVAGVVCTGRLRGLQNVMGMLAGQGLVGLVPIPLEPAGHLVVPIILLYFGLIAALGRSIDGTVLASSSSAGGGGGALNAAIVTVFEQYTSLFAMTRALALLQSIQPPGTIGVLALVYVLLPAAIAPSGTASGPSTWSKHLFRYTSDLAVRVGVLWIGAQFARLAAGDEEAVITLYLLAILATGASKNNKDKKDKDKKDNKDNNNDKLAGCHSMFSLLCAQQLVAMLQTTQGAALSGTTSACVLAAGVGLILAGSLRRFEQDEHIFGDVCAFGLSLILTGWLEDWLGSSSPVEACTVYLGIFALLECVRSDAWSGAIMPAQGAAGLAVPIAGENAAESLLLLW